MTDNPLVEAIGRAIGPLFDGMEYGDIEIPIPLHRAAATAALRAIEDAGYRVVKVDGDGKAK